jgi:hypothetical protein
MASAAAAPIRFVTSAFPRFQRSRSQASAVGISITLLDYHDIPLLSEVVVKYEYLVAPQREYLSTPPLLGSKITLGSESSQGL